MPKCAYPVEERIFFLFRVYLPIRFVYARDICGRIIERKRPHQLPAKGIEACPCKVLIVGWRYYVSAAVINVTYLRHFVQAVQLVTHGEGRGQVINIEILDRSEPS